MSQEQNLLDLLNKEQEKLKLQREKDMVELDQQKKVFANQLRKMKKEELFVKNKISLWNRIKRLLWGN
jgi:hypothetical protein